MISQDKIDQIQKVIETVGVDGWLLFDFRGRNPIAAAVLGNGVIGSRRLFAYIPRKGRPIALIHAIDYELWRKAPDIWEKRRWVRREQLDELLPALVSGKTIAAEYSPNGAIPYLDGVPGGIMEQLKGAGAKIVSSVDLVTRYCSVWSEDGRKSHERSAIAISAIAQEAIAIAGKRARTSPIGEFELAEWIRDQFKSKGLLTDHGPSVSFGANAARTHYEPSTSESSAIVPGQLLLVDLWATEPDGIYADQTWMAAIGDPSARDVEVWSTVCKARDAGLDLLRKDGNSGKLRGADVDKACRQVIVDAGYGEWVESRTGHSIDRYGLHGYGPPIDDTETYDGRILIPGVGFSVEPGIYITDQVGVRSEVNVYIGLGASAGAQITPGDYQRDLIYV